MKSRFYFKLRHQRRTRLSRIIVILLLIITVILASVISYSKLIEAYANHVVATSIQNLVTKQSQGRYVVDFDSVSIDVWRNKIFIKEFELAIAKKEQRDTEDNKTFRTHVASLQLDVTSLWLLWMDDILDVQRAILNKPEIQITFRKKRRIGKPATEVGDLINELNRHLNVLKIDELQIQHADIHFYRKDGNLREEKLHLEDLSLKLTEFSWQTDDALEDVKSDGFYVQLKDQTFVLPDSSAKITLEELEYSLKQNRLILRDVLIRPLIEGEPLSEAAIRDLSHFHFNQLVLSGIDLEKIYLENILSIDTVELKNPEIVWKSGSKLGTTAIQKGKTSTSVIDSLFINHFTVLQGDMNFDLPINDDKMPFFIQQLDAELSDLSFGGEKTGAFSYKQASFNLKKVAGATSDSLHLMTVAQINYATSDQRMKMDSLSIRPSGVGYIQKGNILDISIPALEINGLNDADFTDQKVVLSKLILKHPEVYIRHVGQKTNTDQAPQNTFDKGSQPIQIDQVIIEKANVILDHEGRNMQVVDGNATLLNFFFDNKSVHFLDTALYYQTYLPELTVTSKDKKEKLTMRNVSASSDTRMIKSDEFAFRNTNAEFNVKQLVLINSENWLIPVRDSLHLQFLGFKDYVIDVRKKQAGDRTSRLPVILVDTMQASDGLLRFSDGLQNKFEVNLDVVQVTGVNHHSGNLFTDHYELGMSDFQFTKGPLSLGIDKMMTSSDQKVLRVEQVQLSHSADSIVNKGSVALAELSGFDVRHLSVADTSLYFGVLTLEDLVYSKSGKTFQRSPVTLINFWPEEMPEITLDKVKLVNAFYNSDVNTTRQRLEEINLELRNIHFTSNNSFADSNPNGLLYAQQIEGSVERILHEKGQQVFTASNVLLNSGISASSVEYHDKSAHDIDLKVDSLQLTKVAFNRFLEDNFIEADELLITKPTIEARFNPVQSTAKSILPTISLAKVRVNDALLDVVTKTNQRFNLQPVDMVLDDFYYDSLTNLTTTYIPASGINLSTYDLKFTTGDGLNEIILGELNLTNRNNGVNISGIKIKPLYGQEQYIENVGFETDWIETTIPSINIEGLNYRRFLRERAFIASYVSVNDPEVYVYRDKNGVDPIPERKNLPAALLKELDMDVIIDSVRVNNAAITYAEVPEEGASPGVISFEKMNATVKNVTNVSDRIMERPVMKMHIETQVMGRAPVIADFKFHLNSELNKFEFSGKVFPHEMTLFNPFTEDGAFLQIKSGKCKSLVFTAFADDDKGFGSMYFQYNNFKVALVDKKTADTKKFEESVASFVANTFLVKRRNLAIIRLRKGDIYYERNKGKSIFNYLSKLFTSGVSSSIGFKSHKKEIRKLMETSLSIRDPG
ncbi:hypothetical protein FNH22_05495 [Fulvivirga sp. M361]|uniref:hypothetical protein n=1 Tax=Fulvivirga sp. M361 TaxID=2594266 RepID=UPI0011799290|nr:hypothetical protein [Fulvivirga sp. M361]TRX60506.1 hypothetical protein FNH22_05495 [Fulvivirga sp. M361]